MKITVHTIISVCCADCGTTEINVLGSFTNENEARKCFEKQKQKELEFAEEWGWEIYSDDECYFEAGEDGNFNNNFGMLHWYRKEIDLTDIIKGEITTYD